MGESHGAGDVVRLVFEEDGAPVALMTWAAACYCLKARDELVDKSYGLKPNCTEATRVAHIFKLYAEKARGRPQATSPRACDSP